VTQHHPHGQIYAYPMMLPRTARMLARAGEYRRAHGVPFAARWPYELHLYPRLRRPDLPSLGPTERDSLSEIYLDVLRRFSRLFPSPTPYIAAWHQAPTGAGADAQESALHLELFTNRRSATALKYLAGTESGMDQFSSDVVPEEAARRLRELS
jgi:UDPglucose--hexose-1-phosphate uridylyltransferase